LAWWMVIAYILLFTVQALSIAIIGAMKDSPSWHGVVTFCVITNGFTTTMLAFITQSFQRMKQLENTGNEISPAPLASGHTKPTVLDTSGPGADREAQVKT
ncbi:MAG: hypothetical protein KGL39_55045, partial [Patescibacteria group bacterium]|nr:hypothetical protein [Patescibacteria group bacterium]